MISGHELPGIAVRVYALIKSNIVDIIIIFFIRV